MAERDARSRLTSALEQQREAVEEAVDRMRRRGREVAEGIADALRRIAPGDDSGDALERIEAQQREILTRLADAQREGFQRMIEANEAFWRSVRSMLSEGTGSGRRSTRPAGDDVVVDTVAPAPKVAPARPVPPKKSAAKKPAAKKPPAAAKKSTAASKKATKKSGS